MAIHKGTGLSNVSETWQQNEQNREGNPNIEKVSNDTTGLPDELKKAIQEEAAEYDRANKDERLLGGERASLRDDES